MRRLYRKKRRTPLIVLSAFGIFLVIAAVGLTLYGRDLALGAVHTGLDQAGIQVRTLDLESIRPNGLTLANVGLGTAGGPEAKAVSIGWSPRSLMRGRATTVKIDGLVLNAALKDGSLVVTGLPAGGGGGMPVLPLDRIELTDTSITLASPQGKAVLAGNVNVVPATDGLSGDGRLAVKLQPTSGGPVPLALDIAALKIVTTGNLSVEFTGQVTHDVPKPVIAPTEVRASGHMQKNAFAFSGQLSVNKILNAGFDGAYDVAHGAGSAKLDLAPLRFETRGKQPVDLVPIIGTAIEQVSGTLSGRATFAWGKDDPAVALSLKLDDVGFETSAVRVSALSGDVTLDSVLPPHTSQVQAATMKLHLPSLDEIPVDLRFSLPGDERLLIDSAMLGIAGGDLELANVELKQDAPLSTTVGVKGVDLSQILTLIGVDGLTGTGTLDGQVPIRIATDGVSIPGGKLAARGPGTLAYGGGALPDVAGTSGDSVRLLRQALGDFRYDSLVLTLDHKPVGGDSLLIALRGHNPAVLNSHPFAINVRLDANFQRLATVLFEGYEAFGEMLRRANNR